MSEISVKIEKETKDIDKVICDMIDIVKSDLHNADAEGMYKAADIIKDFAEAKEHMVKAIYYEQILEAMETSEYGKDYDVNGKVSKPNQNMGYMGAMNYGGTQDWGKNSQNRPWEQGKDWDSKPKSWDNKKDVGMEDDIDDMKIM